MLEFCGRDEAGYVNTEMMYHSCTHAEVFGRIPNFTLTEMPMMCP